MFGIFDLRLCEWLRKAGVPSSSCSLLLLFMGGSLQGGVGNLGSDGGGNFQPRINTDGHGFGGWFLQEAKEKGDVSKKPHPATAL